MNPDVTVSILEFLTQTMIMIGGYFGLRKYIASAKDEIKGHNEVTVREANGTFGYSIDDLDVAVCIKTISIKPGRPPVIRYMRCNKLYADLFKVSPRDLKGKTPLECGIPLKSAQIIYEANVSVWSTGQPRVILKELPDGSQRKFRLVPIRNSSSEIFAIQAYEVGDHCKKLNKEFEQQKTS